MLCGHYRPDFVRWSCSGTSHFVGCIVNALDFQLTRPEFLVHAIRAPESPSTTERKCSNQSRDEDKQKD